MPATVYTVNGRITTRDAETAEEYARSGARVTAVTRPANS